MEKTCSLCMNIENGKKVKFTTQKVLVLKSCIIVDFQLESYILDIEHWLFICRVFTSLEKIIVQVNNITCL